MCARALARDIFTQIEGRGKTDYSVAGEEVTKRHHVVIKRAGVTKRAVVKNVLQQSVFVLRC